MSGAISRDPKLHHIPALEGVRGVAVLPVLVSRLLIGDRTRGIRSIAFKIAYERVGRCRCLLRCRGT